MAYLTKEKNLLFTGGASIDAFYGPWESLEAFDTWLEDTGLEAVPDGVQIAVKETVTEGSTTKTSIKHYIRYNNTWNEAVIVGRTEWEALKADVSTCKQHVNTVGTPYRVGRTVSTYNALLKPAYMAKTEIGRVHNVADTNMNYVLIEDICYAFTLEHSITDSYSVKVEYLPVATDYHGSKDYILQDPKYPGGFRASLFVHKNTISNEKFYVMGIAYGASDPDDTRILYYHQENGGFTYALLSTADPVNGIPQDQDIDGVTYSPVEAKLDHETMWDPLGMTIDYSAIANEVAQRWYE